MRIFLKNPVATLYPGSLGRRSPPYQPGPAPGFSPGGSGSGFLLLFRVYFAFFSCSCRASCWRLEGSKRLRGAEQANVSGVNVSKVGDLFPCERSQLQILLCSRVPPEENLPTLLCGNADSVCVCGGGGVVSVHCVTGNGNPELGRCRSFRSLIGMHHSRPLTLLLLLLLLLGGTSVIGGALMGGRLANPLNAALSAPQNTPPCGTPKSGDSEGSLRTPRLRVVWGCRGDAEAGSAGGLAGSLKATEHPDAPGATPARCARVCACVCVCVTGQKQVCVQAAGGRLHVHATGPHRALRWHLPVAMVTLTWGWGVKGDCGSRELRPPHR